MVRTHRARKLAAAVVALTLGLAACGDDDGGEVRDLNEGSGSGSGSAGEDVGGS